MDTELTRQYIPPTSVSASTATLYKHFRNSSTASHVPSPSDAIPESEDLLRLKQDLEQLLPQSETRIKNLESDLSHLEHNVKIRESAGPSEKKAPGKNANAIYERMAVKQETNDSIDMLHSSSSVSKTQLERYAALETLRRRRRREDVDITDDDHKSASRSESPHHIVKLKKVDGAPPLLSRSMSPPSARNSKQTPKSTEASQFHSPSYVKKKKSFSKVSSGNARQQQFLNGEATSVHSSPGNVKAKSSHGSSSTNDIDFVRVKPKDQVPLLTFWGAIEPYFRSLTEEDREFLMSKGDCTQPYIIPPLGQHYEEVWAEEDRNLPPTNRTSTSRQNSYDHASHTADRVKYLGPNIPLTDDYLLSEDLSCGRLAERLLSSLVPEDTVNPSEQSADEDDDNEETVESEMMTNHTENEFEGRTIVELSTAPPDSIMEFEERLKRELRYTGLFGEDDIDYNAREDDEICAELRRLGHMFKEQVKMNEFRKKQLLQVVDCQLQYDQYRQVLDDLDGQIEQCYLKRFVKSFLCTYCPTN
ncbi:Transcriptional regulator [Apophysomyces sp. BC1034]|nr:Transcriptional regulator [Apophysomyces sp. BC1021]KAG0188229.1 Transcriptional regulator [Apophysomyces sp. BC1034]